MDYLEPITKEKLKIIYDEFGATEESLKNDVNILMEWLEKQPHLPNVKDTEWLTHFLLCCKNSLERAKQKLDAYFTTKALNPSIFTKRKEMLAIAPSFSNLMCFLALPKLTKDGKRVIVLKIFQGSTFNVTSELLVNFAQLAYDILMKVDSASQYIMIFDMENTTVQIMAVCFPVMKKLVDQITKVNPLRIQNFYAVNVSSAVEPLINFSISLLSKKLASRTVVWKKKAKDLAEVIDEEVLPAIYGGTEKPFEDLRDQFLESTKSIGDWLESAEADIADLSKKPTDNGVSIDIGDYGVEGTFRKINLD
ncbi:hypothetical protein V9T40_001096 [Parthenolecanium corni]|uniref:CRAL-TRIO domain-containing protein n=1 Tax=Parthenolecanium corni TaxID=536013 RepID=A0AAN9Y124_9HEMI